MKRVLLAVFASCLMLFNVILIPAASASCNANAGAFEVFPRWYKYLELDANCNVTNFGVDDIPKIGIAIIEILLRVAGFIAFVFTVMAGFKFVLSRGNPNEAAKARQTLIDAIIGIAIASVASVFVAFLGRTLSR